MCVFLPEDQRGPQPWSEKLLVAANSDWCRLAPGHSAERHCGVSSVLPVQGSGNVLESGKNVRTRWCGGMSWRLFGGHDVAIAFKNLAAWWLHWAYKRPGLSTQSWIWGCSQRCHLTWRYRVQTFWESSEKLYRLNLGGRTLRNNCCHCSLPGQKSYPALPSYPMSRLRKRPAHWRKLGGWKFREGRLRMCVWLVPAAGEPLESSGLLWDPDLDGGSPASACSPTFSKRMLSQNLPFPLALSSLTRDGNKFPG